MDDVQLARELEGIHGAIAEVKTLTVAYGGNVLQLAERVGQQNHRLDKVEWGMETKKAVDEARQKWLTDSQVKMRWFIMAGLAGAGVLSGIVFSVMDRL